MLNPGENKETIQEIALKLTQDQVKRKLDEEEPNERTIFVLGSKGVGKSSIINKFLDKDEPSRPTLALEYSFGRRSSPGQNVGKQVCNVWELGSLINSHQLIDVPIRSHGVNALTTIIVLDLSQPDLLWIDLEAALKGLKDAFRRNSLETEREEHLNKARVRIGVDHKDINSLDLIPFPLIIVGGKYDIFQDLDPEIKKHVCRALRSISHAIGASLIFYSSKVSILSKTLRDTINHFGFGSPQNPFRSTATDYNGPLTIWFGADSWEQIGVTPSNSERIGLTYNTHIPQKGEVGLEGVPLPDDPARDAGFRDAFIDELRAQKDEELLRLIKETEIRSKFETVA